MTTASVAMSAKAARRAAEVRGRPRRRLPDPSGGFAPAAGRAAEVSGLGCIRSGLPGRMLLPAWVRAVLGGLLFRLSALGAAQLFTRQLFVERLATIDADLAAFVFSAHTLDCGEPRLRLAKVPNHRARVTPFRLRVTLFRLGVTLLQKL